VNLLWIEIIKSVYGNDIDMDSDTVVGARNKIFDNTKAHKWNVLRSMELHVQELLDGPSFTIIHNIPCCHHISRLLLLLILRLLLRQQQRLSQLTKGIEE